MLIFSSMGVGVVWPTPDVRLGLMAVVISHFCCTLGNISQEFFIVIYIYIFQTNFLLYEVFRV